MTMQPARFDDSGFIGPVDRSISHKNLLRLPMRPHAAVQPPRDSDNPIVAVSSNVPGKRRLTFVPVGGRQTVRRVDPSQFPRADLSGMQKG